MEGGGNRSSSQYGVGTMAAPWDGRARVTGQARFSVDLTFPHMLWGKLLYAPQAPARIRKIDLSEAEKSEGVAAVMTAADIPGFPYYRYVIPDMPVLAIDTVRYTGEAVAMVAAETEEQAQKAIDRIVVEYEPLPGVFDPIEAMNPGAPRVQDGKENIFDHCVIKRGDVEQGFREAAVVVERTYRTTWVEHAFLETEAAVALCDRADNMTVYASTQSPHRDRRQLAEILGLPESRVRVIVPPVGGGFGGKAELHIQPHAALLAWKTGRPVKIVRTREESIRSHVKRVPMIIRYKHGASSEGLLTAVELELIGDAGPYANATFEIVGFATSMGTGPYNVPNACLEGYTIFTNNPITGAFRGFGIPQMTFACEQQMDLLAERLGLDPLEIRLKNAVQQGSVLATNASVYHPSGLPDVLTEVACHAGWGRTDQLERQPAPHLRRGIGLACCWQGFGLGAISPDHASVDMEMVSDGGIILRCGAADMGQGVSTVVTKIVGEELKTPPENIKLMGPDTDVTMDCLQSEGSRQTYVTGNAVLSAARLLRAKILDVAAEKFGCATADLLLCEGEVVCLRTEESCPLPELFSYAYSHRVALNATGFAEMPTADRKAITFPWAFSYFACGAQVAQVLVDIETGIVRVERVVAAQDVGKAINPRGVRGQFEGGLVQGYGMAIMEELVYEKGQCLTPTLNEFLIPTATDIPKITSVIVEVPDPKGPYGARGMGEAPLTPVPAAVANAIADALGVRIQALPLTPEKVLAVLAEREKEVQK
jgi:CO/xanthine dehydrogenase Mo-binding subunit